MNNNAHKARHIGEGRHVHGSSDSLQMIRGIRSHRSLAIPSTASRHYDNTRE
jgi:hypothetical protein